MDNIITTMIVLFDYWIETDWYIALSMSFAANASIYLVAACGIELITKEATKKNGFATFIDDRPLKPQQKQIEQRHGLIACAIFSVVSLLARELFIGVLPESFLQLLMEVVIFTLFYETYSYFIHRLLHLKPFRNIHSTHHHSVRVTPWSAYSVHPIEATLISISAPLFMLVFPVHLFIIFFFHMSGVIFTMILHSNLRFDDHVWFSARFNQYMKYHALHHAIGNVNFGFVHSFWDARCKTLLIDDKV